MSRLMKIEKIETCQAIFRVWELNFTKVFEMNGNRVKKLKNLLKRQDLIMHLNTTSIN